VRPRVLVVEDEQHLAEGLRFNLEAEGYEAEVVETGEAALERLIDRPSAPYDVVVLDVMLPGKDGFAVVSEMRAAKQFVPVLILTARGRPEDVLNGFAAGADDYLPKPTELAILLARIGGLLRRSGWLRRAQDQYSFAGKTIDFESLELRVGDRTLPLTLMEANLLRYFIAHEGKAVSRKSMLEEVWGVHEDTDTRAIDNFIVRLRRYIESEPSRPQHVLTVRGVGYRFIAEPR
jgi:DNA-binding response OmpR family regulator